MKKIIQKDNKILRQIAKEIPLEEIKSDNIQKIIHEMHESLSGEADGVALAAPQIAISLRIFVVSPYAYQAQKNKPKNPHFVFINPKIIWKSKDSKKMDEGCLSVRPWYGKVKRSSRVIVEAYSEDGDKFEMQGIGLLAQIFQHETDHFDGILFTDKAENLIEMNNEDYE